MNGTQKKEQKAADLVGSIFGEGEIIKDKRVYTVGSGKGEIPVSFINKYYGKKEYKPGDKVPESVLKEAVENWKSAKEPKNPKKELEKDINEMKKSDTLGAGTLTIEGGGQVGVPTKAGGAIETGATIRARRVEKFGSTLGVEASILSTGSYEEKVSYSDFFVSRQGTDKFKLGMGGPLELGLMSGDFEDVIFMRGLRKPWNLKINWKKTGAWVRAYFGLNYGPWYFLYNPLTKGFYGGFNIWGGIMGYVQTAFAKGTNECEGCGTAKKIFAGLGELIGLSSGIREGTRAWKRSKGSWFQRFFYSVGHFFKGMLGSIGYVGLQVGLVQPMRLFVNSLYRFVFRAKTPKDAKTREFTPEEILRMREKLERELGEGLIDKAKDDVEMWLKYEKLLPSFKGYLMGIRDRIDIMGAYIGLPFTLFPPGWKKSKAKKEIEKRTRNAIAEIEREENVLQNTVYLELKLAGVKKGKVFEEMSPCVVPKDDIAKAVLLGLEKSNTKLKAWVDETNKSNYNNYKNAFEFTTSLSMIDGFLYGLPQEYLYLQKEAIIIYDSAGINPTVKSKAGYQATKQAMGKEVDENELNSLIGAFLSAYLNKAFTDNEAKKELEYINEIIKKDERMASHLFYATLNKIEENAQEWRKAVEGRDMSKASNYEQLITYYGYIADILLNVIGEKELDKNKELILNKLSYLGLFNIRLPLSEINTSSWLLLKYHPEFKKPLKTIETTDVKSIKEGLKKQLDDIGKAVDAGEHENAKEKWDKISKQISKISLENASNISSENANRLDELLKKKQWEDADKREIKSLLRNLRVNI